MAKYSRIEWTDATWSPVTGCAPISEGCQNCYAKRMANRLRGRCGYPADDPFRVTLHPERLEEPLKWKKPRRVFVCSMGDLFHEDVHPYDIMQIFNVMAKAKHHTFLVLTKRPERMLEVYKRLRPGTTIPGPYFSITGKGEGWAGLPPSLPNNIWIGVTAENQARADERIPILLQIPAAVRFVSVEPMLGPVDLSYYLPRKPIKDCSDEMLPYYNAHGFNWVVCGGETGSNARPMHPDWVRSLRDQCQDSGVPFFFKQWGTWKPVEQVEHGLLPDDEHRSRSHMVIDLKGEDWTGAGGYKFAQPGWHFERTGKKKKAGCILDGQIWNEMPKI